jgi:hypothetical protein
VVDDSEWQLILGEVDKNGDGEISFEEFVDMMFKLFGLERLPQQSSRNHVSHRSLQPSFIRSSRTPNQDSNNNLLPTFHQDNIVETIKTPLVQHTSGISNFKS